MILVENDLPNLEVSFPDSALARKRNTNDKLQFDVSYPGYQDDYSIQMILYSNCDLFAFKKIRIPPHLHSRSGSSFLILS
jgi:hypothetical protein